MDDCLYKSVKADVATIDDDGGSVKGYAATFDREPDSYGDVIAPGAFAESLVKWTTTGKPIPLLYGHRTDDPKYNIGYVVDAYEDNHGLYVEAVFDGENETAQYARKLAQEGRIYQFSFAYAVRDSAPVELATGVKANELRKVDLYEVSLVQIPANQHAQITDIKDGKPEIKAGRRNSKADADELRSIADHAAAIQSIIAGLLTDEDEQSAEPEEEPEANAEEPEQANAEEQKAICPGIVALLEEANQLLKKGPEYVS